MQPTRELGTVILTKSITRKEELVGKMLPDGNSVETNGVTYNRFASIVFLTRSVNAWINSVLFESNYTCSDFDSDDSWWCVSSNKQLNQSMPYLKTVSGVKSKMVQFNSFGRNPQFFAHTVWAARNMDPYHSFDMQVIFTTPTCIC